MDKFRVGQMVRKVRLVGRLDIYPIGVVATITGPKQKFFHEETGEAFLGYPTDLDTWAPIEHTIELVYDGDQPVTWEECAWKPVRVSS
jgi:hypothetical protein